jgi:hypothetical protein
MLGAIGPYRYTGILQVCRHPTHIHSSYGNAGILQVFGHPAGIPQYANYCQVFVNSPRSPIGRIGLHPILWVCRQSAGIQTYCRHTYIQGVHGHPTGIQSFWAPLVLTGIQASYRYADIQNLYRRHTVTRYSGILQA